MCLADADARTEVYRLDDNGIAEFLFDIRNYLFRVGVIVLRIDANAVEHGDAVIFKDGLHNIFIHSDRRRDNVAADIRKIEHLEIALQSAVLDIRAVDYRERDVDIINNILCKSLVRISDYQRAVAVVDEIHARALRDKRIDIFISLDLADMFADIHLVVLCDIDRDNIVFVFIHRVNRLNGGNDGNLMLNASAAEHDCKLYLHRNTPINNCREGRFRAGRSSFYPFLSRRPLRAHRRARETQICATRQSLPR